jgi:E3 SUMO-protein ligase RanBP2
MECDVHDELGAESSSSSSAIPTSSNQSNVQHSISNVSDELSAPAPTTAVTPSFSFGNIEKPKEVEADSTTSNFSFGVAKSFSFGMPPAAVVEPTPIAATDDKPSFNFVFKKKSPSKARSPGKSRNDSVNSEGAEEEEEENQTYFTPVIPLPEKIEVETGEEDEELLYCHLAKLYRFVDKEWKDKGDIKILKHKQSGQLR